MTNTDQTRLIRKSKRSLHFKNKIIKGDSFAYKFLKNRIKFDN